MWKCLNSHFKEGINKPPQNFLSLSGLVWFLGIQLEKSLPTFDKVNDLIEIIAMKIEKTPIQFLHDIFAAVAILSS